MTDTRASDLDPEEPHAIAEPDAGAAAPEAADSALTQLARENAELKDRLLRALAEMENLRRRTEREVADSRAYGISAFARDLLGVADNMRRALDAVGTPAPESVDPGMRALIDGVELTERELINGLEKHGVKKLDPLGTKFDPHRHQAMVEVPDPSVPAGTVVQVVQPGYTIGERVLRPALVAVAKGGPKGGAGEGAPASANDNSTDS
jgi:molecular chaperone GrpE